MEKKALKSHFWKQDKAFFTSNAIVSQNKTNTSPVASSTKLSPSKPSFPTLKKQSNFSWVNLSFKLANNGKLTSDKCKKHLKNNLYLYYGVGDHKLDSCSKG